nr:M13 family metallopeptidase [Prevotella sp.]
MLSKVILFVTSLSFCGVSVYAQAQQKSGIDKTNFDTSVKAGENFYQYAVGGWLKNHPLDAEHPMNGAFVDLDEQNNVRIRQLVEDYASKPQEKGSVGQKIGSLYKLYMDSVIRNKQGFEPIRPVLNHIATIKNRKEYAHEMAVLGSKGYGTMMFGFSLGIDGENSNKYIFGVNQSGIGLDPEYYTHPNEQQQSVVTAYKSYLKDLLKMIGNSDAEAEKKMQASFDIENQIAKVSYDQVKSRDPRANIHKTAWNALLKNYSGIDWVDISKVYGYPTDIDTVDVGQPEPVHEVEKILANSDLFSLKAYMEIAAIKSSASVLSDDFSERRFEFIKAEYGIQKMPARWKRGVGFIQGLLGESIGKLYVAKYFPERSKKAAIELVHNLQKAFAQRLQENTWMTATTKAKALDKLNNFKINIGYPDKWQNMEDYVQIDDNKTIRANYDEITVALRKKALERHWRKPVDRTEWDMNPQEVNAFYSPTFNSINFPAAILQAPFFDPDADAAANYGGIGTVIGHEMSHAFDDEGCQFDKNGNLNNWWTAEDKTAYAKRTKVLADWFSDQEAVPGLKVDVNKTLGENIGDNGGIKVSFRAFENQMKENPLTDKDGFTPAQRFFLSYARIWASNIAPQFVAYIVNSDVHSPNMLRVNAALPMIDAWYNAFGIKEGDKMFVPVDKRAHIW